MHVDFSVVLVTALVTIALASVYFRRLQVNRPPVGVVNARDVWILLAGIVAIPYLYLALPLAVVATLLAIATIGILLFTFEPVARLGVRLVLAIGATATDIALALTLGTQSNTFLAVNNAVLAIAVIGIANLWAQSGMRAVHVAAMALGLAVYDVIATLGLPLMTDLIERLNDIPLVPFLGWRAAGDEFLLGFGDLLLLALFPLVIRKAFGRRAAAIALAVTALVLSVLLAAVEFGLLGRIVPAMVVLGPVMAALSAVWLRRQGRERTSREYLTADAPIRPAPAPNPT